MRGFKIKYVISFLTVQMIFYPAIIKSTAGNHNITELHFIEQDIMKGLSNYISTMKENLIEYEDIVFQAKQDILNQMEYGKNDYPGNPISVFCLVKRFSEGWGKLARFIREDDPTTGTMYFLTCYTSIPSRNSL